MAWNESFSGPDAGGWAGDTSFATSGPKDTESTKVAERLPVPVTISVLSSTANSDEKYILGDFPFSTVLILGNVKSYQEQDNSTMYLIGDPEDMEKDFQVINYNGISESDLSAPRFVEGTRVMALGKLRSLSDIHGKLEFVIVIKKNIVLLRIYVQFFDLEWDNHCQAVQLDLLLMLWYLQLTQSKRLLCYFYVFLEFGCYIYILCLTDTF
uniref:TFIIIC_sub6 domain-containing protein n=1 Tax=Heterorhabditis bacteriophora TaxID=37862 RepID=A0A1I7XPW8_HETBA